MKKITPILFALLVTGCGDDSRVPQSQKDFISKVSVHEKALDEAKDSKNTLMIESAENEIKSFLKGKGKAVSLWYSKVDSVKKDNDNLLVNTSYENQEYSLVIVDPEVKGSVSKLKEGDILFFSGQLGRELSFTLSGAVSNPEFRLLPTEVAISTPDKVLSQDTELINQYFAEKQKLALTRSIKNKVSEACMSDSRKMLVFPNEADFSILNMAVGKISDNRWLYRNTVETKNAYGNTVTVQVSCTADVKVDEKNNSFVIGKTTVTMI